MPDLRFPRAPACQSQRDHQVVMMPVPIRNQPRVTAARRRRLHSQQFTHQRSRIRHPPRDPQFIALQQHLHMRNQVPLRHAPHRCSSAVLILPARNRDRADFAPEARRPQQIHHRLAHSRRIHRERASASQCTGLHDLPYPFHHPRIRPPAARAPHAARPAGETLHTETPAPGPCAPPPRRPPDRASSPDPVPQKMSCSCRVRYRFQLIVQSPFH